MTTSRATPLRKQRKGSASRQARWVAITGVGTATIGAAISLIVGLILQPPAAKHPVPTVTVTVTVTPQTMAHSAPTVTRYVAVAGSDSNNIWVIVSALGVIVGALATVGLVYVALRRKEPDAAQQANLFLRLSDELAKVQDEVARLAEEPRAEYYNVHIGGPVVDSAEPPTSEERLIAELRTQLDELRDQSEHAMREGDVEAAARLLYGQIPRLEREIAEAIGAASGDEAAGGSGPGDDGSAGR